MKKQFKYLDESHPNQLLIITQDADGIMSYDDGVTTGECFLKDGKLMFCRPAMPSQSVDHVVRWKKLPAFKIAGNSE